MLQQNKPTKEKALIFFFFNHFNHIFEQEIFVTSAGPSSMAHSDIN